MLVESALQVLLGLSCTKDVQNKILTDPERGPRIAAIEMKYGWYAADGSGYAPRGGVSLAPGQQEREWKGNRKRTDAQTARQIREYRNRYPDKAILWPAGPASGWAVLTVGGSLPILPLLSDRKLLEALPAMKPFEPESGLVEGQWALAAPERSTRLSASA